MRLDGITDVVVKKRDGGEIVIEVEEMVGYTVDNYGETCLTIYVKDARIA